MLNKISRMTALQQTAIPRRAIPSHSSLEQLQQTLKKAGETSNPLPMLQQVRVSPLFNDVLQMVEAAREAARGHEHAHLDPDARLAAAGYAICHAVGAVTDMAEHYELTLSPRRRSGKPGDAAQADANERAFMEQIKPKHVEKLRHEFSRSWEFNDTTRQAAILSAITPEVAAHFGLISTSAHDEQARVWGPIAPDRLLHDAELLALLDYVHSQTGTFNAVNGSALVTAYYGDKLLAGVTQVFSTALNGAIFKLSKHPYFGKTNITTYKGVNLTSHSGPFRQAMLEAAVGTRKLIVFPQVLSATSDPLRSYAVTKHHEGYFLECEIVMPHGFDADPFHDISTMGEMEILGPAGQKFIVAAKREVTIPNPETGGSSVIERFVLDPAVDKPGS